MKKRIPLFAVGFLILLIPTFIMLSFYFSNRDIPVEIRTAKKMVLISEDQKSVHAQKDGSNSELLAMFCDMTFDAKLVGKKPKEIANTVAYNVTFYTDTVNGEYRFYFGENPAYCYFVKSNNAYYRIVTEKAAAFLNSDFSESVYKYSAAPDISVNGQVLRNGELEWEYRRLDGSYKRASCSGKNDTATVPSLGIVKEEIQINCTPVPDSVILSAYSETGEKEFEGTAQEFADFTVKEITSFTVVLTVNWDKDEQGKAPFGGKAVYLLYASKHPPARFSLSKTEVEAGEAILLTGKYVTDPDKITVKVSSLQELKLQFRQSDGQVKALLTLGFPDSYFTDTEYELTVTCPDMKEPTVFKITVKGQSYDRFIDYVKQDVLDATYTEKTRAEFADLAQRIIAQPSTYCPENATLVFGEGVLRWDTNRHYSYGTSVMIASDKSEYRALDKMYGSYSASRPVTVAEGKVVYTGETALTGKLVVIDHGNGLRSWYCNLSEITVAVGDVLGQGIVIGNCRGGGFNGQAGINMHVALTLHDRALNLDIAIRDGIEY
ncbi:MAG: M23 family metallopeptidase [Ruminococcaceae bacterium]|nr:M23 family metallopeptidase [Oscillospiraceae bacterium]